MNWVGVIFVMLAIFVVGLMGYMYTLYASDPPKQMNVAPSPEEKKLAPSAPSGYLAPSAPSG
ncbi:hypothetical protein EB118_15350, partial [bacterium]|nr:hypothetical protein [bacterium]